MFLVNKFSLSLGFKFPKQLAPLQGLFWQKVNVHSHRSSAPLLLDNHMQQLLNDLQTRKNGQVSIEDWNSNFRLINSVDHLSTADIRKSSAKLIRVFVSAKMYAEAASLMNYLNQNYPQVVNSPSLVGPYLRLCAETIPAKQSTCNERSAEIEKWLARLPLSSPYDLLTASDIIAGIAVVRDWKQRSETLLAAMSAGSKAYDNGQLERIRLPLISSAVRDQALEDFNILIRDILTVASRSHSSSECNNLASLVVLNAAHAIEINANSAVSSQMLSNLINELESVTNNEFGSGFLVLKHEAATALASAVKACKLYNISKWFPPKDTLVTSKNGKCRSCNVSLPTLRVSNAVFGRIKSEFFKHALPLPNSSATKAVDATSAGDSSVYFLRSTPQELDYFRNFLEKNAPFDVVIDGLNVSHRHGNSRQRFQPTSLRGGVVLKMANYYATAMKQRVLIVAKKHVERTWSQDVLNGLRRLHPTVKLFLSDNLSDDDSLLISAALASGPDTQIISHDDFRQPAAILPNDAESLPLRPSFRRWLASRHAIFLWWDDKLKVPVIQDPRQFVVGISRLSRIEGQQEEVTLHIPYESEEIIEQSGNNSENKSGVDSRLAPISLLCLKGRRNLDRTDAF